MLILTIAMLALLTIMNFAWSRNVAYPPFIYSAVWSIALFLLWLVGNMFYPLSIHSLVYYFVGATAFSAGGLVALLPNMGTFVAGSRPIAPAQRRTVHRTLDAGLAFGVICFPLYLNYMRHMADFATDAGNIWQQMRRGTIVVTTAPGGSGFRMEPMFLPLFTTIALIGYYEYDGGEQRRWRTYALLLTGFAYALCSTARSEVALLFIGIIGVAWVRSDRPQLRVIGSFALVFLAIFTVNQIILEKTNASVNASFVDNIPAVSDGLAVYAVGGLVAFDYVVDHPGTIVNGWRLDKFFTHFANKFGTHLEEPSRHLAYVNVGVDKVSNVYTTYFPFIEYGLGGTIVIMAATGSLATLAYRRALRGSPIGVASYALSLYGIVMSIFAEELFSRLGLFLKELMIVSVLYYFLPRLLQWRAWN